MSKLETNTIDTISGTSTLQVGSTNTSTITLGVSGDTINVPSGVTINNNGTQTGFGGNNTPCFYGEKASDLDLSRGVVTQVTGFTTEEIDTNSAFDGTTFTVPSGEAGKYFLQVAYTFNFSDEGGDGENAIVYLYKNDSNVKQAVEGTNASNFRNMNQRTVTCNAILDLSVGDTIKYYAYGVDGDGGGGGTIQDDISHVMGYKLIGV